MWVPNGDRFDGYRNKQVIHKSISRLRAPSFVITFEKSSYLTAPTLALVPAWRENCLCPLPNILHQVAVDLLSYCQATVFPLDAILYTDWPVVLF